MNLRHGQLWQRLGLTVLSGILVASLAPATAAAPVTGQEISDDAGSFSGDVSSVGTGDVVSDVAQGSDVSDGVDASAGDSASEAAASNEGKGATSHLHLSRNLRTYPHSCHLNPGLGCNSARIQGPIWHDRRR